MKLVMDTENARALAVAYGQQSDEALRLAQKLMKLLDRAVLDDTNDVAGSLNALGDDLHLGDVVLRHQADIMDGLTVDVDALSQEMGVERWEVDNQLRRVERGEITAGEALISLVDFGAAVVTGLDTTVRDFVPDAPPIGQDPEFDALVQRLDGWLLSAIIDGRSVTKALTGPERVEDFELLATRLGMPDPASVEVTREFVEYRRQGGGDDPRKIVDVRTIPLPTSEHRGYMVDWVTDALIAERKLSRAVALPTIGELVDLTSYEDSYRYKLGGGDADSETRWRTRDRTAKEIADEVAAINRDWKDLAWLPAVLAGQAAVPPELATDAGLRRRVVDFAKSFGYHDADSTFRPNGGPGGDTLKLFDDDVDLGKATARGAIQFLVDERVLTNALANPEPVHKARLPLAGPTLDASIEFGRAKGVVTEEAEANARVIALHLSGLDITTDLGRLDPTVLAAKAPELATGELVGLLATAIPPHLLTENRLTQAITYVSRADTLAERVERIEQTILGLKTVTTVGEPAMTTRAWLRSLPSKVRKEKFDTDVDGDEFNWLLDHVGVPGYHKSGDWRRGKGKRYFHLVNEVDGSLDDFIVESIPKKSGWFGQAVMTVAKVAMSVYFPPMGAAIAGMDAAIAASKGDWLGAGMAALGAVAAGTAVWASSTSAAASAATNTGKNALAAIAEGTGSLHALSSANQAMAAANSAAALANTAANGAALANAGFRAGVAFAKDDILGGVVNSVTALGAGASTFGYAEVGQNLATTARVIDRADTTVGAIGDEDIVGALAGGLGTASSLVDLGVGVGTMAGTVGDEAAETLGRLSTTLDDAAALTRAGGGLARGIADEEWAALVGGGLRFGSSALRLVGNEDGAVSGLVADRADEDVFDASVDELGRYQAYLDGAADLADGGLALARGDELGGAALLSSGTSGLLRSGGLVTRDGFAATNLVRLDAITDIADKVVKAGPGIDHATAMGLIGPNMQALLDTFENEAPAFTRSGDVERDLRDVRVERQAAQAGLDTLDDLLAFDTTDGVVGSLLGTTRNELAGNLAALERAEARVALAYREEMAARRAAEAASPSHVPVLRPPLPSHVPLARPDDLDTGQATPTLTAAQQAGIVDLARLEHVAAVDDHRQVLERRLDQTTDRDDIVQLRRDIDQLQKRRDGLVSLMTNPTSHDDDYDQFDGTRFIVDDNMDATLYYLYGSDQDTSGPDGPRTPVVLGAGTRQRFIESAEFQTALRRIVTGISDQPGGGKFQVDRTLSIDDYHIGRTQFEYNTVRNPDNTLTTTITLEADDGVQDPLEEWLPSEFMGIPVASLIEDGLGPSAEVFGRPYLYEPFSLRYTYTDHQQGLAGAAPTPPASSGLLLPSPPRPVGLGADVSFDDFPRTHPVSVYENHVTSPDLVLPDGLGDWYAESALVVNGAEVGPYKLAVGGLGVVSTGRETFSDGRIGLYVGAKYGARMGIDGPVPFAPAIQAGYAYDRVVGGPIDLFGTPVDVPGGGISFQALGPSPDVAPEEMYSLANPWSWPEGASVRLNGVTGTEHHAKAGNSGDWRLSLFDDELRHDLDFFQTTNQGDRVEISQGPVEVAISQPGVAANFPLPLRRLGVQEGRFAGSYQFGNGKASVSSVTYDPSQAEAYRQHLLSGRPAPGAPTTHTDAIFGVDQGWVEFTAGPSSPRFDSNVSVAKLIPRDQWFVASSQTPDGLWKTDYSSGGGDRDRIVGSTTIGPGGSIDDLRITSAVSLAGSDEIPFELDAGSYTAVLEAIEHDRDPLLAVRGRPGIPDELFADAITRAELRDRLVDIQNMGELSLNHPIAGNLRVRETPRGEPILELANPYPAELSRALADRWMLPGHGNPPFRNTVLEPSEVVDGFIDGAGDVVGGWYDGYRYARDGSAKLATLGLDSVGLGALATEADRRYAAEFDAEFLEPTIESGRAIAGSIAEYSASRWENRGLIPGDLTALGQGALNWVGETAEGISTAYTEGDGEALGRAAAHGLGIGVTAAVPIGAAAKLSRLGRATDLDGPDLTDGPDVASGPDLTDGPDVPSGGPADRAGFERYRAELEELDVSFPGGPANRTTFEKYRAELREQAQKPPIEDPGLRKVVDDMYRPGAPAGNGSTVAAARREWSTGRPTVGGGGNESLHHQKVSDRTIFLKRWLEKNPDARPGDRQAAEDLVADHERYLEQVRTETTAGPRDPIQYEKLKTDLRLEEAAGRADADTAAATGDRTTGVDDADGK